MDTGKKSLLGSILLSWIVAIGLYVWLVIYSGVWEVLANTRVLSLLIDGGFIRHTDADRGFIDGLPDQAYFLRAIDPVKWQLVGLVVLLFIAIWAIEALYFHYIAEHTGLKGSHRQHAKAFLYGLFYRRLWPYQIGDTGTVAGLDIESEDLPRAYSATFLFKLFFVGQVALFALYGLMTLPWRTWFAQLFWALVILGVTYLWTRRPRSERAPGAALSAWKGFVAHASSLLQRPRTLARIAVLAIVAFGLKELAAYLLAHAFTGRHVILNPEFSLVLMAVCSAYAVRLVPLTPGGLGLFEWAFAISLYVGGMGMPEAVTIALIYTAFHYGTYLVVYVVGFLIKGSHRGFRSVWELMERPGVSAADFEAAGVPAVPLPYVPPARRVWSKLLPVAWTLLALFLLDQLARLLANYWLLESMALDSVFWTNLGMGARLFFSALVGFAVLIGLAAFFHPISRAGRSFVIQLGLMSGVIAGYLLSLEFTDFLLFGGHPFNQTDPVFGNDLGFYIFTLPNLYTAWQYATAAFVAALIASVACAWVSSRQEVKTHLWGGVAAVATPYTRFLVVGTGLLFAIGVWFERYFLLYRDNSASAIPTGACYLDLEGVFSTLNLIWVTTFVVLATTIMLAVLLTSMHRTVLRTGQMEWTRAARWLAMVFLVVITIDISDVGFASLVWMRDIIFVKPNEPVIQLPYIKRHIDATRAAWKLDRVEEIEFEPNGPGDPLPDLEELLASNAVANAPLWPAFAVYLERLLDPQHKDRVIQTDGDVVVYAPALEMFQQKQKLRTYYDFLGVDPLRYTIDGKKVHLFGGVRELPLREPQPWLSWWGQRFVLYTHGYGLVVAHIGQFTSSGEPVFLSKEIPAETDWPQLQIENPRVYYGEGSASMALSNISQMEEFDYPTVDGRATNVLPKDVDAGVRMDGVLKRIVFGWLSGQFFEMVMSRLITDDTRVHYMRTPLARLNAIAPFAYWDSNTYAIPAQGGISWLGNGITTSDWYPYSRHDYAIGDKSVSRTFEKVVTRSVNYVEDSIKATIDAYTGQVRFYKIADAPVVDTWADIYPDLFVDESEMPEDVRAQLTYPFHLFHAQFDDLYIYYQMVDPMYFFNMEDMWDDADEVLGPILDSGRAINFSIEPYYLIVDTGGVLPEAETRVQFSLMAVFTPERSWNLRGLPIVYQDGNDYGRLMVLKVAKGRYTFGPEQADSVIDQDPVIAGQISWWNRMGAEVIRGHTTPMLWKNEVFYVEPLFIRSEQIRAPQLKQVVAVVRGTPYMADTVEEALRAAYADLEGEEDALGNEAVEPPDLPAPR